MTDFQNTGFYLQGDSLLHRLDPRLKLVILLLLIFSLFAASGPYQLLVFLLIAVCGILVSRVSVSELLLKISSLRWLLLSSFLLHLFFTPGRTLFGFRWLSYDGMLRGLEVDLQLIMALVFSYLLALTTSPVDLSWGLTRLLSPLKKLGVPIQESGGLLLLVLHFLPLMREEVGMLNQKNSPIGFVARMRSLLIFVGPLLLGLVERADALAHNIVTQGFPLNEEDTERNGSLNAVDLLMIGCCAPVLVLIWMM